MNAWGWVFVISAAAYWSVFIVLARSGPRKALPIGIGVLHMLIAMLLAVAPMRSFFDPDYLGLSLGVLRFEGRAATLPAAVILVWALASAWLTVAWGRGRPMLWVAAFDLLFAMNQTAAILRNSDTSIQFGNALTITGVSAVLIMLMLFALGPLVSSGWALRRVQLGTLPGQ
jgi:hypothetical protein